MTKEKFIYDIIINTILGGTVAALLTAIIVWIAKKLYQYTKKRSQRSENSLLIGELIFFAPPLNKNAVLGRSKDIKAIHSKLTDNKVVWLTSIGGIGKSTVASEYAKKYKKHYNSFIWLHWESDLQTTLQSNDNVKTKMLIDVKDKSNRVLYELSSLSNKVLIIFDGIDTYTENDIRQIEQLGGKVLITTRTTIKKRIEHNLNKLDKDVCRQLFRQYYKNAVEENVLDDIINKARRHTLTLKLFAIYADNYSLKQLLSTAFDVRYGEETLSIENVPNRFITEDGEYDYFINRVKKLYQISFSSEAKEILSNIALFPAKDTEIYTLVKLLSLESMESIKYLINMGWLETNYDDTIYLHPILASAIREADSESQIDANAYKTLVKTIFLLTNVPVESFIEPYQKVSYIDIGISIIKYYRFHNIDIVKLRNNIAHLLYVTQSSFDTARKIFIDTINILNLIKDDSNDYIISKAATLSYYSDCLNSLGLFDEAIETEKKAMGIYLTLHVYEHYIAYSLSNLILYYADSSRKQYLRDVSKDIEKYRIVIEQSGRIEADIYHHYALLHIVAEQYDRADMYFKKAKTVYENNDATNHYGYWMLLNSIGGNTSYLYKEECKKEKPSEAKKKQYKLIALKNLKKSIILKQKVMSKYHKSLLTSYHNYATSLDIVGKPVLAIFYERKALIVRRQQTTQLSYYASSLLTYGRAYYNLSIKCNKRWLPYFFKKPLRWWLDNKSVKYIKEALRIYEADKSESDWLKQITICNSILDSICSNKNFVKDRFQLY